MKEQEDDDDDEDDEESRTIQSATAGSAKRPYMYGMSGQRAKEEKEANVAEEEEVHITKMTVFLVN